MPDFTAESNLKARRQHSCCECQGLIMPGETYQRVSGRWDGRMNSFQTCRPCVEARKWATSQLEWTGGDEHLFYFEMLEQDLHDTAMEIHPGTGRRFKAYSLQINMVKRRLAAQQQAA